MSIAAVIAAGAPAVAGEPAFPPEQIEFFEKSVRPLLATHCVECHGPKKQNGNLRLDHRSFLLKGGDTGPAVAPGKPDESLLIEAINYASYEMPPTGRLKPEQIAVLTKWVELGAPWPDEKIADAADADGFDLEARKRHWSFRPIAPVPPPEVRDESWPRDDLDRFVLAKLEAAGLRPAEDADKRTLIRRAYFDLIGLPPPPEKVAAFLADDSPRAFERVVDELLASPHFGERWGRHWLDLVRYAETLGHEFDFPLPHAWRYRDYVVRAFNADVPYDEFVREHVAGDLLANPRLHPTEGYNESIIATGFWHLHDDVQAPVDVRLAEATRFDNQIDVFGKAFLGLTVACARCHDHKFDPITAADYYALAGFLKSSRRQVAHLDPHGTIAATTAKLKELRDAAAVLSPPPSEPLQRFEPVREGEVLFEDFDGGSYEGWTVGGWAFGDGPNGVADSGRLAKKLTGSLRSRNFTISHDVALIRVKGEKARVRLVVDGFQIDQIHSLLFAGLTTSVDTGGEWTWLRIAGDLPNHKGRRGYIELLDEGEGWLAVDEIRFTNSPDDPPTELVGVSVSRPAPPDATDRAGRLADEAARLTAEADALADSLPAPIPVLAMQDGPACDEELFIRGNHENTAGPVPRRFLEALDGRPVTGATSGRLELANRLLADDNPFPARVMANRVWQHLFGEGIVRSVDNFGVLGDEPTHPELLDHLADGFRRDGWSVKRLIRRIVLSRTYRMASTPHPESASKIAETDPTNRLLHAQRLRRLEGEALRDAMLAVSGRLDPTVGGESVPVHLTPFMQGRGRPESSGPLDGAGRRSLYVKVRRNFVTPLLTAFDFPPPATTVGRRNVSNVPAQALILLNDPFVLDQAKTWAQRMVAEPGLSSEERIRRLYEAAFTREPTTEEIAAALAFLEVQGGDWQTNENAWADLCHVLFNGKEFVFVR
ncbi:MAG TPA: PSD1 and planctomycete cytochrome C domain-containing protein [Planctomycetaceae bacterium]